MKKDLALYKLLLDGQLPLSEGEDLNTHHITEDNTISSFRRDDELLVTQENQPNNKVRPHCPIHEHEISPLVQDSRRDSPPVEDSISLRDRGNSTLVGQTNTGPLLWRSKRGRIPQ